MSDIASRTFHLANRELDCVASGAELQELQELITNNSEAQEIFENVMSIHADLQLLGKSFDPGEAERHARDLTK